MIKIIQVSTDTNIGGAGKCIITFLKNFDRSKFDVSVVLPPDSLLKPQVGELEIPVYEVGGISDKSFSLSAVSKLRKLFRELKPGIVHTHASMSARIAAKQLGIKVVYTRHSVFDPPPLISKGLGKFINGAVNNYAADTIIAVAEAAKDNLIATGVKADRIKVVLNGVDPLEAAGEEQMEKIREGYGITPEQKVVSIIARLNEVKGHLDFVDAAKIVLDKGIDVKFIIAGTGDAADKIRERINSLGLREKVIMAGFVTDVAGLLSITGVQVNCSFGTEATSLSLLEGMSLGIPAVVTDFGGNRGVIQDGVNGFVVPVKSPEATAEAIVKLLSDGELYDKMRKNCITIYNEKFTSRVYTKELEKIYGDM